MDIQKRINDLKVQHEKIKTQKIELTVKLNALEEEKKILLKECEALGVDPKSIGDIIKSKEQELNLKLSALENILGNVK